MSPRAWSTRRRLPTRQALLFLIAILVPCVLLVALSLRMIAPVGSRVSQGQLANLLRQFGGALAAFWQGRTWAIG